MLDSTAGMAITQGSEHAEKTSAMVRRSPRSPRRGNAAPVGRDGLCELIIYTLQSHISEALLAASYGSFGSRHEYESDLYRCHRMFDAQLDTGAEPFLSSPMNPSYHGLLPPQLKELQIESPMSVRILVVDWRDLRSDPTRSRTNLHTMSRGQANDVDMRRPACLQTLEQGRMELSHVFVPFHSGDQVFFGTSSSA